MKKSILTISRNPELQKLRALILKQEGFQVSSALNDNEAMAFVKAPNSFALVLLCHSVPETSRLLLVNEIKEVNPKLPVLMLYNGYDPTAAKVDGSLHNLDSPEAMLQMVRFLTMQASG